MSNPQYGFDELAAAQSQPEVTVNAALRAITQATSGQITINFASDADYELQASDPPDSDDEWAYGTIRMTDTGPALSAARFVIFPDLVSLYGASAARHRFVFVNDTAQTLTVKGEATSAVGVEIGAGASALLRYNGTDVEAVAAASGGGGGGGTNPVIPIQLAASTFGEALQSGTSVAYFRAPFACEVLEVRAAVLVESTSGDIEVDILAGGASILSTPITIDEGEKTSESAATSPSLVTNAALSDDEEVTINLDVGTGCDAEALLVTLLVRKTS